MKLWIARDKDGELCLYKTKPWKRINTTHHCDQFDCDDSFMTIDSDLFPEVTFENSPRKMKLIFDINGL